MSVFEHDLASERQLLIVVQSGMPSPYTPPKTDPAAQQSHFLPLPLSAFITIGLLARIAWLYFAGDNAAAITNIGCVAIMTSIIAFVRLTE